VKILHIIVSLSKDGAQTMLYRLLARLDGQKYQHTVISLRDMEGIGDELHRIGIPIHAMNMEAGRPTPSALKTLHSILRSMERPDLIQGWDYYGDFAANVAKSTMRWKAPVIWAIHHTPFLLSQERRLTALLIRLGAWFSRSAGQIVYVSWASRNRHEALGYSSRRARVIPNGFDPSEFKPSLEERALARSELGIGPGIRMIGSIARFHPMKDHANFLNAAGRLMRRREDVHFLLAGREVDNSNPILMDLVRQNCLDNKVHFLGVRSDIKRLMNALDIFTVSSAWGESFPLVIGEAMLCGVPCVVTDVGDSARVVADTGLVVPPRDPQALCHAWERLLGLSIPERRALGESARRRVIENYSLSNVVGQYETLFVDAISTPRENRS
jgi:glycosyltransferase involved in cell wall biosynthesis